MIGTEVLVLHAFEGVVDPSQLVAVRQERLIGRVRFLHGTTCIVSSNCAADFIAKPRSAQIPVAFEGCECSAYLVDSIPKVIPQKGGHMGFQAEDFLLVLHGLLPRSDYAAG
jgi:hypothetical protein